ncbi:YfcC family protein [Anaeromicrobium sediminis]|nr:TIGR00366 family protein [Anaeromicrobium sediminis]
MNKKKSAFRFKMPSTAALLFIMILVVTIGTYIIPAGEFQRVVDEGTNRTIVVAGTYEKVEQSPVGIQRMLSSVYRGLTSASDIIAFIFVVGGSFGLVSASGAINAALGNLIKTFSGRESALIAILMTSFAICGATFGMAEEALPFVAILVTASLALGFDEVVGVAMVVVGIYCGYSAGPLNPFNTGIAQGIAELPLFSGLGLRMVLMAGGLLIAVHHTIRYAKKVKESGVTQLDENAILELSKRKEELNIEMTNRHKLILFVLACTIGILVYGVLKFGWYFAEISALFLGMALLVGLISYGKNFEEICSTFLKGAGEMTSAAIFVGLSRAILVVTQDGKIMDTIVNALSIPLSNLNSIFAAWGMYIAQGFINFIIPSSTGQAVVVMPIMSSLSDLTGVTRQVAVLAFEAGDGYWNMITPTHPVVMASIGLAGISFSKWFKFALGLVAKWTVWILTILAVAVTINWGPF